MYDDNTIKTMYQEYSTLLLSSARRDHYRRKQFMSCETSEFVNQLLLPLLWLFIYCCSNEFSVRGSLTGQTRCLYEHYPISMSYNDYRNDGGQDQTSEEWKEYNTVGIRSKSLYISSIDVKRSQTSICFRTDDDQK